MKKIGGQAVIDGVMMMSQEKYAVAVRDKKSKIVSCVHKRAPGKCWVLRLPFVRGVVSLVEMLAIGTKALTWSANVVDEQEEELGFWSLFVTFVLAIALTVGIFILLPYYLARFFSEPPAFLFNILDGIFRLAAFFVYLFLIGLFKDVGRMFEYHGAEHMSVHCYEAGRKLTFSNIKKFKKEHARCGTSLLVFVIVVSILMFSLIRSDVWWINILFRIFLIPVIAGISYELLKLSSRYRCLSWLSLPGIWTQKLTTRKPDRRQVEVAVVALNKVK